MSPAGSEAFEFKLSRSFGAMASDDPLLPWLRSIRQVKQDHAQDKSKILPYLLDCYKEFRNSVRYHNDPRFLRICVQLADCSPDPLKIMAELDERGIGHTHALFYEAYATCLEAKRRFGDANNVYKRGLASQAQSTEKLINSYTTFRERMDTRKKRKREQLEQHARKSCNIVEEALSRHDDFGDSRIRHMEACQGGAEIVSKSHLIAKNLYTAEGLEISFEELRLASACKNIGSSREQYKATTASMWNPVTCQSICKLDSGSFGEETIQIRNFAAEVITGKEKDVEDARHHGLVDPTINTKEALHDILSMFCKPLDFAKKEKGKPATRVDSLGVSLLDHKRKLTSPKVGKQTQPLEFSVFKDDEESESPFKSGSKPAAVFPLLHDENKATRSPLGILPAQPLELCVYKDEEDASPQKASAGLCHEGKAQSSSLVGSLQARPLEFSVFNDDELEEKRIEPRNKMAEKRKNSYVVNAHPDRIGNKPHWQAKSEEESHNSAFFVFKDEEPSEEEEANAFETKECKGQCGKVTNSKQALSEFLVFKDESIEASLPEKRAGLFCHDVEANIKGKRISANKMLACGIENLLPQSPLYQP
ncbi:hypothetical protein GOP47_0012648 [Adiantum capillus-veneris]|uniref:BUB1 N-terminal domain-containing protein n=1 Tax=Adiantum capillus-veneris TaxID=13818 RepID=A0A9D4URL3_ADICA|nr:hypothetical protein GOP47_0012648 [Adiantum capillus-veneris]